MQNVKNIPSGFINSLYWRLAGFFFVILLLLGILYLTINLLTAKKYFDETAQKLNANVAPHLLLEVDPFIDGKVNDEAIGKIMHSMMAVNPGLEVYLLDPQGKILSYVVLEEKVRLTRVTLDPIKKFIDKPGQQVIYGDDPKNPGKKKIFSATEVKNEQGQLEGYVYMILMSEQIDTIAQALQESYLVKMGVEYVILASVTAFILGLYVFWRLMRGLRETISVVKKFEAGDLEARIQNQSTTEVAALAETFNSMANTILRNMEDLKQVDSLRRELIANVSHDIRTPISVIHGYVETLMIKEGTLTPDKKEEYFKLILKSTEKLKRLVSDLFELSKLEARQVKPKTEVFFMADLLQDISQKYKLLAQERNITLSSHLSSRMLMVNADIAMMERVLQNLIDNALKYTPQNGFVNINMVELNDQVEITIENSGEGIAKESISKIFDRYYKEPKNVAAESTGLGLAIVKNILQIHNTDIQVISEKLGLTSFSFKLPVHSL